MEDDSFKYLGHENLGELVAELRNKMGVVTTLNDMIKLENESGVKENSHKLEYVELVKKKSEETLVKVMPLILRYLNEFGQYDLDNIKKV